MVRIDLMKQHLCDVLYGMCETRRLAEITLTDVAREAGVSRQTLYNHFIDLDDLICYAASRPLYSGAHGFTSLQNAERAYELSLGTRDSSRSLPPMRAETATAPATSSG